MDTKDKWDWSVWPTHYKGSKHLQLRRELVCSAIEDAILACPYKDIKILSICAGDGSDVIKVLTSNSHRNSCFAYLVELDPNSVALGRASIKEHQLESNIEFLNADATISNTYKVIVPVDIIILAGVFAHMSQPDSQRFIDILPSFCRSNCSVIWTRFIGSDSLIGDIPKYFETTGFKKETMNYVKILDIPPRTVVCRYMFTGTSKAFSLNTKLFTFKTLSGATEEDKATLF